MGGSGLSLSLSLSAVRTYSDSQRDRRELENITVTLHTCFQSISIRVTAASRYSICLHYLRNVKKLGA